MGESNTPPVSPKEFDPSDHEDDGVEVDELEVIELSEEDVLDSDGNEELNDNGHDAEIIEEAEDVPDDAVLVFKKHTGSVFCCSLEPKEGKLAVSGGEDDKAYVWNITDGEVVFECGNHNDSVTCALFSHDGTYVATGDMSGLIQVWKVATKSLVWSFEMGDLNWLDWHPATPVLFAGSAEGETWMWKIPSGDCKTFAGHGDRNECGKLLPDGKRIAIGYMDGSVKVFDLKSQNVLQHLTGGMAHTNGVSAIDAHRDNNMIATGSLDSTAKLYNTQTGKVLTTLMCQSPSNNEEENAVEAVTFCPDAALSMVVTGTLSGKIIFWDIPSQVERQSFDQEAGVVKLIWHPKNPHLLFSAGLDGAVRLIDAKNGTLIRQYTGHTTNILDIAVSHDGYHVLTSSDDNTCRVFEVNVDA